MEKISDEAVQATNDDASECKRCAVQLGYWSDPYIQFFVKATDRKAPEINRGYYARTMGVWYLLEKFLQAAGKESQVINLGAGFDTLYWRLKQSGHVLANYVEVDFPTVTSRKCHFIKRNKQLLEKIHAEDGEIRLSATDLHASGFHIIGADLRNIKDLEAKLLDSDVKFNAPTFILSECVLVYVEMNSGSVLLKFFSEKFSSAVFVNYEQVNIGDRFGEVMLKNLRARGCPLAGAEACYTLSSQEKRFLDNGWDRVNAFDMVKVYNSLPIQDRQRIEQLELLDEQEILIQLFQHYCIVVAVKGNLFDNPQESLEIQPLIHNLTVEDFVLKQIRVTAQFLSLIWRLVTQTMNFYIIWLLNCLPLMVLTSTCKDKKFFIVHLIKSNVIKT